jgi:hypothetical protein
MKDIGMLSHDRSSSSLSTIEKAKAADLCLLHHESSASLLSK